MKPENSTDEVLNERVGRSIRGLKWIGGIVGGILIYLYPLTIFIVLLTDGIFGELPDWSFEALVIIVTPAEWLYGNSSIYEESLNFFLELRN